MRSAIASSVLFVASACFAATASAGTIDIVDGNSNDGFVINQASAPYGGEGVFTAENNFLEFVQDNAAAILADRAPISGDDTRISLSAFYGAQLTGTASSYKYEFFGSEAGYNNSFWVDGAKQFETGGKTSIAEMAGGDFSLSPMASYLSSSLGFEFISTNFGGVESSVNNFDNGLDPLGNNPVNANRTLDLAAFGAICIGSTTGTGCTEVWLLLDDGGAGLNGDYDDMIIRITAMPLPAAAWMLIAGVGGLAFVSRKRQARRA